MSELQVIQSQVGFRQGPNYSTMPRPAGDGMDCEALRNQENITMQVTQSGKLSKGRHGNLSSSSHTTTHAKVASRQYIPHEPFKGAVKPVSNTKLPAKPPSVTQKFKCVQGPASSTNVQGSAQTADKYELERKNALQRSPFTPKQNNPNSGQNKLLPSLVAIENKCKNGEMAKNVVKTVQVPIYNAPSHLKISTYETIQRQQKEKVSKGSDINVAYTPSSRSGTLNMLNSNCNNTNQQDYVLVNVDDVQSGSGNLPDVRLELVASALEEMRLTEGKSGHPSDVHAELEDAKKQLETQIKVNSDLKKLLVASMGDDLHCKVDRLVRDRVQLSEEIGGFTRKMYQDHEELDKLAIQADMWQSKYMASKVMVDQLITVRDELCSQMQLSRHGLYQILQERNQLRDSLLQIHRHLRQLKEAFDPNSSRKHCSNFATVLDLAHTNLDLSESVKFRLLGPLQPAPEHCDRVGHDALTSAEHLACMLLSNPHVSETSQVWLSSTTAKLNEYQRFHPQVRYDNLTFNCCRKCKGDVHVI